MRLILAPHHDDALLSLPELLLAQAGRAGGARDRLAVVFSEEDPPALARTCDALHRGLGLVPLALGFPEARRRGLPLRRILRGRRTADEAAADPLLAPLAARLHALAAGLPEAGAWLAPSGYAHLDHALVRLAAERVAAERGIALLHYTDEPYGSLWPAAGARARRGLRPVAPEATVAAAPAAAVRALLAPLAPFVGARDVARLLAAGAGRRGAPAPLWRAAGAGRPAAAAGGEGAPAP